MSRTCRTLWPDLAQSGLGVAENAVGARSLYVNCTKMTFFFYILVCILNKIKIMYY